MSMSIVPRPRPRTSSDRMLPSESIFQHDDDSSDISEHASVNSTSRRVRKRHATNVMRGGLTFTKVAVFVSFLVTAAAVSMAAYFFSSKEESSDFESAFTTASETIVEGVNRNAKGIRSVFETFSLSVSSLALDASTGTSSWPLVTIPNWQTQAGQLANLTGSQQVGFLPLVTRTERDAWEPYSTEMFDPIQWLITELPADFIWRNESVTDATPVPEDRTPYPYYAPIWQTTTVVVQEDMDITNMINRNGFDIGYLQRTIDQVLIKRLPIQTEVLYTVTTESAEETPVAALAFPIFAATNDPSPRVAAILVGWLEWLYMFMDILPENDNGVLVVVESLNNCQLPFTMEINGPNATFLGEGDLHNSAYNDMVVNSTFEIWQSVEECGQFVLSMYPSKDFQDEYQTSRPWIYTGIILAVFFLAFVGFILYDWRVERHTEVLETRAARTSAIVNSLFPANVRDRLIGENTSSKKQKDSDKNPMLLEQAADPNRFDDNQELNTNINRTLGNLQEDASGVFLTKPIADLFPEATVMFADIAGFTAWSSTREPSQVFTLLETTYNAFDKLAKRRKVFKVETIGDCYVAVAGLPDPRKDHALVMVRFANDCLMRMKEVVQRLEVSLGPDTADLGMRFGLHSGPVTAGVLRGEKSRFQLFGDTVNTAARIESTGQRDKIHLSAETAELLKAFGKSHWVTQRETTVQAKGKGEMQTYWLKINHHRSETRSESPERSTSNGSTQMRREQSSVIDSSNRSEEDNVMRPIELISKRIVDNRMQRLIGWNVDVLKRQLRQILSMRDPSTIPSSIATIVNEGSMKRDSLTDETTSLDGSSGSKPMEGIHILSMDKPSTSMVLEEVKDIIQLPSEPTKSKIDPYHIEFSAEVVHQLTDFVTSIAQMYHDNPFHCFEHASHVTMSVCKLLARVVTPQSIDYAKMEVSQTAGGEELHKYTYGITSDPICQFACALAALIHDVDHPGVPNAVLVEEQADLAKMYRNKSCAEQNSFDLAWGLLMEPHYAELRSCIYSTPEEMNRFRQLLVNSVMATDIADRELGAQRKARWEKAFAPVVSKPVSEMTEAELLEDSNRKATIVIEHLIQASDVSHTMQHWHVYIKWNEKLFQEMYKAHKGGRVAQDPSVNWYKSEIGFFDFYLIPLAKKLKECGVFGVASDEYLSYVQANRKEWESKGEGIVATYIENYKREMAAKAQGE